MTGAGQRLGRIAKVFAQVERAETMRLSMATIELAGVEARLAQIDGDADTQSGWAATDRLQAAEFHITVSLDAARTLLKAKLGILRALSEARCRQAQLEYWDAHRRTEELESLVRTDFEAAQLDAGRRMQAAADDRFGSRLQLLRARERSIARLDDRCLM